MTGARQTGHAALTQHARGLQRQRGSFGNAGEQAPGRRLILDQLLQRLMGRQMLRANGTARQDDQVERLREQIHQHRVSRQAGAAGTGQHAPPLDTGDDNFHLGAAQHVNQGDGLQVIDALGEGNQGSKGHVRRSTE